MGLGMVPRGLPNHLNDQSLGEDSEMYHFASFRQAKTLITSVQKELAMRYQRIKGVFVRAYHRFRFGRWETVSQHWRSHPGQLSLF